MRRTNEEGKVLKINRKENAMGKCKMINNRKQKKIRKVVRIMKIFDRNIYIRTYNKTVQEILSRSEQKQADRQVMPARASTLHYTLLTRACSE